MSTVRTGDMPLLAVSHGTILSVIILTKYSCWLIFSTTNANIANFRSIKLYQIYFSLTNANNTSCHSTISIKRCSQINVFIQQIFIRILYFFVKLILINFFSFNKFYQDILFFSQPMLIILVFIQQTLPGYITISTTNCNLSSKFIFIIVFLCTLFFIFYYIKCFPIFEFSTFVSIITSFAYEKQLAYSLLYFFLVIFLLY